MSLIDSLLSVHFEKSERILQAMSKPVSITSPSKDNSDMSSFSMSPYKSKLRSSPAGNIVEVEERNGDVNTPMKKKKNKFRYGPRDSLTKRYSPGKVGSRRYNRFMNDVYARTFYKSDTESDLDSDIWDDLYDENYEPSYGGFADLFLNEDKFKSFDPFIDITEEKQSDLLDDFTDSEDCIDDSSSSYDDEDFDIRRSYKKVVKRNKNSTCLHHIDSELYKFQIDEKEMMFFSYEDGYRRLLVHSVSDYYKMQSYSKCMENGDRITVVHKKIDTQKKEKPLVTILHK
jgi:hypothetical protein